MVGKTYDWENGADLDEHTQKKLKILEEYFREYLKTRCQHPKQEKFKIVIVDGFCGGGLYKCGSYGSPLLFVDTLFNTTNEINFIRESKGLRSIHIECLLILNDKKKATVKLLEKNLTPLLEKVRNENQNLILHCKYYNGSFEAVYPVIKNHIKSVRCNNVFFNLDQCGYSHVSMEIIRDIIISWRSAEILLTFMIASALAYLSPNKKSSKVPLEPEMQKNIDQILVDRGLLTKKEWLGIAENIIFTLLKGCATYVSPFSINNPSGWQYWLMHFANSYRARQVYNNILHKNSKSQAHFGRHGLTMLSYDPREEGSLYLFDEESRELARNALYDDIPRLVSESGDTLLMSEFYSAAYSETAAHSDDIHKMIISNPDIEIITQNGGTRKQHNTIRPEDTIKLSKQMVLFSSLFPTK